MAAKRAKFKVEEISDEKPEVSLPVAEEAPSESVVDTKPEVVREEVADPKDLGASTSESSPDEIKDWLKDVKPDVSKEVEKSSSFNPKVVIFVMLLLLVIGAVVGGFFYYNRGVVQEDSSENTEPVPVTVVPSSEVSPTKTEAEEASVVKDLKVQILNGSGKVGEAGVVKNALIKLGYTSGNITTGNAASYDFKDTEVAFKEGVSESLLDNIKKELAKYTVVKAKTALEKDSKFDISITVGTAK